VLLQHFLQQQVRARCETSLCIVSVEQRAGNPSARLTEVLSCYDAHVSAAWVRNVWIMMWRVSVQFWKEYARRRTTHAAAGEGSAGQA
jgi:hypothetical protein